MKQPKIMCDNTEMVIIDETEKRKRMGRITYDKIANIVFESCKETGFLKEIPSEKIVMNLKGQEKPLFWLKKANQGEWESYKAQLRKFCKDNRIPLYDNIEA